MIGRENSRPPPLDQSQAKPKLVQSRFPALKLFTQSLSSYWLLETFFYVLIGFFDYFGFGLTLEKGNRTFHSQLTRSLDGCASDVIVQLGHHSISRVRHDRAEYTS